MKYGLYETNSNQNLYLPDNLQCKSSISNFTKIYSVVSEMKQLDGHNLTITHSFYALHARNIKCLY